MVFPIPNSDEIRQFGSAAAVFIGNFHKTLQHDQFGEVMPQQYRDFMRTCLEIEAGSPLKFERTPAYAIQAGDFAAEADPTLTSSVARFVSPLAAAAKESFGPDPKDLEMLPAPSIASVGSAAEMVELYWMALLRDLPFSQFNAANLADAVNQVRTAFQSALDQDEALGSLRLGLDLPSTSTGQLDIRAETLFRSGLKDEEFGPLVSQFFLREVPYGTQTISVQQVPYRREQDFLTTYEDWLLAQNTGKDKFGRDYGTCNHFGDQQNPARRDAGALYYPDDYDHRYISTMRDLARFVNRDALHQAYFNAALFLDAIDAPVDDGNPYKGGVRTSREGGFATLGGPDLLTFVSEVASRALKVVWRQKWLVHRRCRPEVYGGLLQMQRVGINGSQRNYNLPANTVLAAADTVKATTGSYFLPMAFSAGSPNHPAYGAGHATVAGACVTALKAWFDEGQPLGNLLDQFPESRRRDPLLGPLTLLQPGAHHGGEDFEVPQPYSGADADRLTVGGELNKLASNVAMGRSMGGVHWRSDNTRSLRLGEQITIEILKTRTAEYFERPISLSFRSFDGDWVSVGDGRVRINGNLVA